MKEEKGGNGVDLRKGTGQRWPLGRRSGGLFGCSRILLLSPCYLVLHICLIALSVSMECGDT